MRKIILFFITIIFLNDISIAQTLEWARNFGGKGNMFSEGVSVKTDRYGNVYSTGFYIGTVDFDPGNGVENLNSTNKYISDNDIYISKLDSDGNFIWAKSIDGVRHQNKADICLDTFGNCYIIGNFEGTVDFNPGVGVYNLSSKGDYDIFILKLDMNGNFLWVRSFGGSDDDIGRSIAIDKYSNIYATGGFRKTVDFDPGNGVENLTSNDDEDIFILKMDMNGNFVWAKSIGGFHFDYGNSIEIDFYKNIYITGIFSNIVDFNPNVDVFKIDATGAWNIFILKLSTDGNFVFAKSIEINDCLSPTITIDLFGNIFVSGYYQNTRDFDPGINVYALTSNGKKDIFILKLDLNGDFLWAKSIGGSKYDYGIDVTIDKYGNSYLTGAFQGTIDINPDSGVQNITSKDFFDAFILKLNSDGHYAWGTSFGNIYLDQGYSISIDAFNNVYLTGVFSSKVDFDPGPDTFYLENKDNELNAFVLKLSQCPTSFDTMQVQTCDSYTWIDGKTYTESTDTAEYTLTNAQGCDSIVSLDLTIYKKDSIGMQIIACNEYIWKQDTLENTGIYRYDTLNIYGCDSTITLDLTINKSSSSSLKITSCDSYIWHDSSYTQSGIYQFDTINSVGCDSTVTLDLTLNSSGSTTLEKSACESYTWHDSIYTSSGTYRFDTLNITGCDSIVTLNLTIVDKIENLDTMYICQGDTIEIFDNEIWENKLVSKTFTSQKSCDSIQNIQVVVNPLPEGTITESICEGDSIFVLNQWLSEEGTYTIHKENAGECDSLYSVNITLRPLKYSYDTIKICQGDTIEVFGFEISTEKDVEQSFVGSNDCDSTVYMHITVLPLSSSQSQITLCPGDSILIAGDWIKTAGEYQEYLVGKNGCDSISNIQVKVLAKPEEPSMKIDCDVPEIILSTTAATPWHIHWDNGDTTSQSTYQNQSQAILTLQTDRGCKEIFTIALPTLPDLAQLPNLQDTIIDLDQTLSLSINMDTSNWQINWSPEEIIDCPNCQNISISPKETTVIKLSMTHSSGCIYSREFTLYVQEPELEIPNIFTPNGDGINDSWKFRVPKEIKLVSCTIFDRWGEKLYQSRGNTPINWDGKYGTGSVLSGVYVYIIEYVDSEEENRVLAGDVTVVR